MSSIIASLETPPTSFLASQSSSPTSTLSPNAETSSAQFSQSNTLTTSRSVSSSVNGALTSTSMRTSKVASTTATSPTTSATSSAGASSPGASPGLMAGIAVAVALGALILMGLIFFYCWRRRRRQHQTEDDDSGAEATKPSPITRTSPLKPLSLFLPQSSPMTSKTMIKGLWGNNSKSSEMLTSSPPQESQSFGKGTNDSVTKPAPVLPISEPIRIELKLDEPRISEPLFSEPVLDEPHTCENINDAPKSFVVLDQGPGVLPEAQAPSGRPVSETTTTTIATSSEVQTPKRMALAVQRPFSTATSTATSFEDDWEFQLDDDVPPLPEIPNTQLIRTLSAKRSYERPTRLDLVARDDNFPNKALNSVLLTPTYDNGNVKLPTKTSIRSLGRPQFGTSKGTTSQRPHLADLVSSDFTSAGILFNESTRTTPSTMSPPTPYDIPLRHSSIAKAYMDPRKQSFLMESSSEDSTSERKITLRPMPLSYGKKFGSPNMRTSIQNMTYPAVPLSASEARKPVKRTSFSFELPIKLKSVSEASTLDEGEQSPLLASSRDNAGLGVDQLQIVDREDDSLIHGSSSRADIPASRSGQQVFTPSDFAPSSDDYLTPKRTQSSELIDGQFVMVTLRDQ